jgi:hypothetical protein
MWQLWDMGGMECVCENLEGNHLQTWNLSSQSPAASSLHWKISLIWGPLEVWPQCSVAGNCLENASGLLRLLGCSHLESGLVVRCVLMSLLKDAVSGKAGVTPTGQ